MWRGIVVVGLGLLLRPGLAQANYLGVFDTATFTGIASIHSPYNTDVKISPDATRGYLAREGSSDVLAFDAITDTPIGPVSLPDDSEGVAFMPDGRLAYVTSPYSGLVS